MLQLWDAITGEELHSFQHNRIVKGVAFSQDSCSLVTGSTEKLIRVFDINKPEESKFLLNNLFTYFVKVINICTITYITYRIDEKQK